MSNSHALVILVYSWEMYHDYQNDKPEVPSSFQWYRQFNALCRAYGKTEPIDAELEAKWQLFLPFATLLDQALRALPPTLMVLYRGMSRKVEGYEYPPGLMGAWAGVTSSSSD